MTLGTSFRAVPRLSGGGGGGGCAETKIFEWKTKSSNIFPTCTQENQVFFILSLVVTLRILIMFLILGGPNLTRIFDFRASRSPEMAISEYL